MSALKISEVWTYPVKSLGGIRVKSAKVFQKGLETDRRWMLIDDQNVFMTQRVHHRMALFRPSWEGAALRITHKAESILVTSDASGPDVRAQIWDDVVTVREVDPAISEWFSDQLSASCRLVTFPESNSRPVDPNYRIGDDQVSLADGYPVLIIGQSSLDDLNNRMEVPVPMNRFRPNLVFTGGVPYEEDTWSRFRVGVNLFAGVKLCGRCALPTVDQSTGIAGKEPSATLSKYRVREGKVRFGMNLIPIDHKQVNEGDDITF
jgi:uncharacterized protein YcbX